MNNHSRLLEQSKSHTLQHDHFKTIPSLVSLGISKSNPLFKSTFNSHYSYISKNTFSFEIRQRRKIYVIKLINSLPFISTVFESLVSSSPQNTPDPKVMDCSLGRSDSLVSSYPHSVTQLNDNSRIHIVPSILLWEMAYLRDWMMFLPTFQLLLESQDT